MNYGTKQNYYTKEDWPKRSSHAPGQYNGLFPPSTKPKDELMSPLNTKRGFFKNFVIPRTEAGVGYLCMLENDPYISYAEIKEGIFAWPQLRE